MARSGGISRAQGGLHDPIGPALQTYKVENFEGGGALSCRRFEEVDLAAFLREPRDEVFAAFRDHYPRCPECSAELRVWGELLEGVDASASLGTHPSPEELECYDRAPSELPATRSDFVSAHLLRCRPCAEELHALRGAAATVAGLSPNDSPSRWRRLLWHPVFGLAIVGLVAFPLLYQNLVPGVDPAIRSVERPEASADRFRQGADAPEPEVFAERVPVADERSSGEALSQPERAQPTPADKVAAQSSAKTARPAPSAPVEERAEPLVSPLPSVAPREFAADARDSAPLEQGAGHLQEADREMSVGEAAPATAGPPRAAALRDIAPRKSEDPLAHHVWIPTMRLRPGQSSWGPISDLGDGFFLEVPLPRDAKAGEARVLIIPDAEGASAKRGRRREALSAETRALDALSGRNESDKGDDTSAPREQSLTREFEERVPVEAKQRALMLQIPGGVLDAGRYSVELELRSAGVVAGRGRFRLELVDE